MRPARHYIAAALYGVALAPMTPWLAIRALVFVLGRLHTYLDELIDIAEDTRPACWLDDRYLAIATRLYRWSRRARN